METDNSKIIENEHYDWDAFWDFAARSKLFLKILYFVHFKKYKKLLKGIQLRNPRLLELGAGTGVIPQKLILLYGGSAVLVDNNLKAYDLFQQFRLEKLDVKYLVEDIFNLQFQDKFDIVCSDGLLEHFFDKKRVLELHKKAVKPNGYIIIFVPHDSIIFRQLNKGGPKCGSEELFKMDDLISVCKINGLKVINTVAYFFEIGVLCKKDKS